jgi:hypothetical protein
MYIYILICAYIVELFITDADFVDVLLKMLTYLTQKSFDLNLISLCT